MEVIRNLRDKNCPALYGTFKLIKVGSWYYWKSTDADSTAPEVYLDLAPYTRNRGLKTLFDTVPFEDRHLYDVPNN